MHCLAACCGPIKYPNATSFFKRTCIDTSFVYLLPSECLVPNSVTGLEIIKFPETNLSLALALTIYSPLYIPDSPVPSTPSRTHSRSLSLSLTMMSSTCRLRRGGGTCSGGTSLRSPSSWAMTPPPRLRPRRPQRPPASGTQSSGTTWPRRRRRRGGDGSGCTRSPRS